MAGDTDRKDKGDRQFLLDIWILSCLHSRLWGRLRTSGPRRPGLPLYVEAKQPAWNRSHENFIAVATDASPQACFFPWASLPPIVVRR